jgi:MtaA/CmuA family methyltransferase
MDLMDDEPFAHAVMGLCADVAIEFSMAQIQAGCDTMGVGDAIASQISRDTYERLILPHEQRLVQSIQQAGAYVRLHICGNITHLLEPMAALGVDIVDCDWQVDMKQARKALGTRVVLTGNLDPVQEVLNSTPERIRSALARIYDDVGNPYFVNAGCEIPVGTPVENLRALCDPMEAS